MKNPKKLIVANWKMNPARGADARKLWKLVQVAASKLKNVETVVCPPLTYLESLGESVKNRNCVLGAQDAFWEHAGPYTGQVSPDMIFNARARYVLIGHSELRAIGETDDIVNKKLKSVLQFPLIPILCIGEMKRDDSSEYVKFVKHQLKKCIEGLSAENISRIVIAYEPVWAISSAKKAKPCTPAQCREMVLVIRQILADVLESTEVASKVPILYGGSVNADDAAVFLDNGLADGLLVGHASLDSAEFVRILKIAEKL